MKLSASLLGEFKFWKDIDCYKLISGIVDVSGQSTCPPPLNSRTAHSFVLPQQVSAGGVVLDEEKCVYAFRDNIYQEG